MALDSVPPHWTYRPPPEDRVPDDSRQRGWAVAVFAIEFVAVIAFLQWFGALRHWGAGGMRQAVDHGWQLVSLERALHLFIEPSVQSAVVHRPLLERLAGMYYGGLHLAVPAVAAVVVRSRSRERYLRCRRAFVLLSAGALAVFWLWPLAPPRLMPPSLGFVDVLSRDVHLPALDHLFAPSLYNGVAAMPSLHVGFATWAAVALWPVVSPRLRPLLVVHPVLMTAATVATGNHFLLDAAGGLVLLAAALRWQHLARVQLSPALLPPILVAGSVLIWMPVHAPAIAVEDVVLAAVAAAAIRRLHSPPQAPLPPAPLVAAVAADD